MSEEHQGAPCGLCGNFNHIAGDDLTTARGKAGPTGPLFLSSFHSAPTRCSYCYYTLNTDPGSLQQHSGTCSGLGGRTEGEWYFGFEWLKEARMFSQMGRNMNQALHLFWQNTVLCEVWISSEKYCLQTSKCPICLSCTLCCTVTCQVLFYRAYWFSKLSYWQWRVDVVFQTFGQTNLQYSPTAGQWISLMRELVPR